MKPTYLHLNYKSLSQDAKRVADKEMDGSNFDCNKCGKIIMAKEAMCMMGGAKGEIPDICFQYGAVCKECYDPKISK